MRCAVSFRLVCAACGRLLVALAGGLMVAAGISQAFSHPPHSHQSGEGTRSAPLAQAAQRQTNANKQQPKKQQPEPPDFLYDAHDASVKAEVLDNPNWYDADVLSVKGALWIAWLEFQPGKGDQLWLGARDGGNWAWRHAIVATPGSLARPTLTQSSDGHIWLSWEAERDGTWGILVAAVDADGNAGEPRLVSQPQTTSIQHRAASNHQGDKWGGIWFVWQGDNEGQFDIFARLVTADTMTGAIQVSDSPRGDWHPAIACTSDGAPWVVWDGHDGESFNVYLRTLRIPGDMFVIAASPALEARPDVVIDPHDRIWIAWEEGGNNWGRAYRPKLDTRAQSDEIGPLHRFRLLHVAVVEPGKPPAQLKQPLAMPMLAVAAQRPGLADEKHRVGVFYERARLAVDGQGRVWAAYRHYYTPWMGVVHRSHVEGGWGIFARYYSANGWSKLHRLSVGQGDGLQRLELAPHGEAIAAVFTTGRTDRRPSKRPRGIALASLEGEGDGPQSVALVEQPQPSQPAPLAVEPVPSPPATAELGGKRYQLFFGDLHRHTDLSLCRVPCDGTIDDAYRYAIDAARLNFLAITDHSRDLSHGDALSQVWWRNRKQVYRHQLGTQFIPFYGYERSHDTTADHNVISLRGDMLRPHTYPVPEFWKELDPHDTLTIPHNPIRRETWDYQDDERRPLAEIFQGGRNQSIATDIHKGLAKGYWLGFIASSDHMSTSASYACVWAEEASRESIFHAMQARRTYGATAKIWLVVHACDHWMGEKLPGAALPPLRVQAEGTAPIRAVNLMADGQVVKTLSPNERKIDLTLTLEAAQPRYVYIHLVQADGNEAWSSPIWLENEDE